MRLRVAVVGCGGMGRQHLEVLANLAGFHTVALCDVAAPALAAVGDAFGVSARFEELEGMLDATRPDLVVVATQTRHHCAPAVAALRRGISVLCEKPMAIDPAEADAMVEAARASGAKLAVHQQNHVNPALVRARSMLEAGVIGDLVLVRGRNKHGRAAGNEFMEMGTHVTDMMLVAGGTPAWVAGSVWWQGRLATADDVMEAKQMAPADRDSGLVVGDQALGHYAFDAGALGEIHFLGYGHRDNGNFGVDILGTEGQLAVRAAGVLPGGLWRLPRPMEGKPEDFGDWQRVDLGPDAAGPSTVARFYQSFAATLGTDAQPPASGDEGRIALEMVLGIYASHVHGGARVPLPLADRRHPLEAWRQGPQAPAASKR